MKKPKKGKGKSNKRKVQGGYKSIWVPDAKGVPQCYIAPKPEKINEPEFKKKDTIANAISDPESELKVKPSLSKPKAPVTDINLARQAKGLATITTPEQASARQGIVRAVMSEVSVYAAWAKRSEDDDWYHPESEQAARVDLELKQHYTHLKGHMTQFSPVQKDFVGPPKPTNEAKPNGYSFAHRKTEVRTGLSPSGLPISDFLQGGKYPPKEHVVTPSNIENNNEFVTGARVYPEDLIRDYEELTRDLSRKIIEFSELTEDYCDLKEMLAKLTDSFLYRENKQLKDQVESLKGELWNTKQELNMAMWEISIDHGEPVNASDLSKASLNTLANQFNIWKVQLRDNPLHKFCVDKGVPVETEQMLRDKFDHESYVRCKLSDEHIALERIRIKGTMPKPAANAGRLEKLEALRQQYNPHVIKKRKQDRLAYLRRVRSERSSPYAVSKLYHIEQVKFIMDGGFDKRVHDEHVKSTTTYKVLKGAVDLWNTEIRLFEGKKIKQERIELRNKLVREQEEQAQAVAEEKQREAAANLRQAIKSAHLCTRKQPPKPKVKVKVRDHVSSGKAKKVKTQKGGDEVMTPERKARREAYLKSLEK